MPNIKSAIKRVKVNQTKNLRNRVIKSRLKTLNKKFVAAVADKDQTQAAQLLKEVSSAVDKAAAKGTLHKNAANRKKAQLARAMTKVAQ